MCYSGNVERNTNSVLMKNEEYNTDKITGGLRYMSDNEMIPQGNTGSSGSGKSKGSYTGTKILLLIICSPFLIAAGATLFGLSIGACGLVFGLMAGVCAIVFSFIFAGIASVFSLIIHIIAGHPAMGLVTVGIGLLLAGIGILFIPVLRSVIGFSVGLIKKLFGMIRRLFRRRTA